MIYINITLHIHHLWILSPLLHDIYYQQSYKELKCTCVVLILILKYTFVFTGVEAAPQGGPVMVGITLREFLYVLKLVYYYDDYYYYYNYYY
jgi:hypothetical protein